jgi:hypothetical protein
MVTRTSDLGFGNSDVVVVIVVKIWKPNSRSFDSNGRRYLLFLLEWIKKLIFLLMESSDCRLEVTL